MSSEKTEEPTEHRLQQAREEGRVPVSKDLAKCLVVYCVGETLLAAEGLARSALESLFLNSLEATARHMDFLLPQAATSAAGVLFLVFAAQLVIVAATAVAGFWGQFGVLISPKALAPKPERLNPASAVQQIFSKQKLQEMVLWLVKLGAIGIPMYLLIHASLPEIAALSSGQPADVYAAFMQLLARSFRICMLISFVIAIADFAIQRKSFLSSMRMSREEVIREYKEMEGDPMVKGQRKQIAMELAMSGEAALTEDANAVVVNPTHFAVALYFDEQDTPVPVLRAKGRDAVAQAMIRRAHERGIPVVRHVWLARTLYATVKHGMAVPRATYTSAALVYAVVDELKKSGLSYAECEGDGAPPA
ncbi:EscU/YscU/HrcU family type III secretion system export apparatus switch protein [Aquabacterium sp. A7-Y]|uniref:EscU/YscU/HrcU family type III secretion system export apparatus switch protein n=1 Tax=Aquabacterium sp. A7-Y TaxID=1349605 RepID=UPI00223CA6A6|nr:EscU/YscU/HrcU family type III secretion system export apparatus switch protein [Aquabacterium sp. A7-Y]MCW7536987.1 EscU/YscU/HrcU family type III secretion system export apparatus switch protein [Aquabacterium sp. A7-Y]